MSLQQLIGEVFVFFDRLILFVAKLGEPKRLTENELSDFSRLWHDGCVRAIIEAQDVDRNHSAQV